MDRTTASTAGLLRSTAPLTPLRTAARAGALLAATLFAATLPAAAQGPATITGHVYDCDTGRPLANAAVRLRGLDDGQTIALTSGRNGYFARVGLAPGRYLIEAAAPLPAQPPRGGHWVAPAASRLARVETDDKLDLRIGTDAPRRFLGVGPVRRPEADEARRPQPACDDPLVPAAVPMSDRYIIH
jgi:Carboxypeptidase regulatory-like domain